MDKKKVFLTVQSALCIAMALWLAAAAVIIYREGLARRKENPLEPIYTPAIVAAHAGSILPLFVLSAGMTIAGTVCRIRDENEDKPAKGGRVEHRTLACAKALRTVLLAAAAILLIAGVCNGSARDVFGKAVKICTECVGLG